MERKELINRIKEELPEADDYTLEQIWEYLQEA